ncbi:chaperone modulator CbpM [Pelobium manganitolerans]|uniref:chaperone modulator CbpM n=1 Tax=Pelobium manganitolerans TaxID=1842495 RepID=UPI003FA3A398
MTNNEYITLAALCEHYQIEMTFIEDLKNNDLLEITYLENAPCIHQEALRHLEKMFRLHQDLQINVAGIDAVFHLLNQVEDLQHQIQNLQHRLQIYE